MLIPKRQMRRSCSLFWFFSLGYSWWNYIFVAFMKPVYKTAYYRSQLNSLMSWKSFVWDGNYIMLRATEQDNTENPKALNPNTMNLDPKSLNQFYNPETQRGNDNGPKRVQKMCLYRVGVSLSAFTTNSIDPFNSLLLVPARRKETVDACP